MGDKFNVNFFIVLPGAIMTVVILCYLNKDLGIAETSQGGYSLVKVIPYLFVLIAALYGMNVLMVIVLGVIMSSFIGLTTGYVTINENLKTISHRLIDMQNITIQALT